MAITLSYTDLITPDELKRDQLNRSGTDWTDNTVVSELGASYKEIAIQAIKDVTSMIEEYLDRKLIVRKYENIVVHNWQWCYNHANKKYEYYARQYPVIETDTTGLTLDSDNLRLYSASIKNELTYYAGFKRQDQSQADVQTAVTGLSEDVEDLPAAIRRVAVSLCFYELNRAQNQLFGEDSRQINTGQATITVSRQDKGFVQRELSKLSVFRWM